MSPTCDDLEDLTGALCLVSAVFWLGLGIYMYYYMFRNPDSRDYRHPFHYLILAWLLLKLLYYVLQGANFLSYELTLWVFVQVINSLVHAADFGCLNPVARGWRTTYIHMHEKEWAYTYGLIFGFFLLFLLTNLSQLSFLETWFQAVCELFVLTLQIYYASETVKIGESVASGKVDPLSITLRRRVKLLRKVLTVLFADFMKMIYVLLVNMDIRPLFVECEFLPYIVLYIAFDLLLSPFILFVFTPRKSDMDLKDIVEPENPLKVKLEIKENDGNARFIYGNEE